jgi:hypothetical protein
VPWSVYVGFDWRAEKRVINWPALKVSDLGFRSWDPAGDLDWLLLEARHQQATSPDVSWSGMVASETAEKVSEVARRVKGAIMAPLIAVVAIVGLGAALSAWRKAK